jgi:hypothetical protein
LFSYTPTEHRLKFVVGVVALSPVIQSTHPVADESDPVETVNSTELNDGVAAVAESPLVAQPVATPPDPNPVIELTSTTTGVAKNVSLNITSVPMGKSSR